MKGIFQCFRWLLHIPWYWISDVHEAGTGLLRCMGYEAQWPVQLTVAFIYFFQLHFYDTWLPSDTLEYQYLLQPLLIQLQSGEAELNLMVLAKNDVLQGKENVLLGQTAYRQTMARSEGCLHYPWFTQSSYFVNLSLFSLILLKATCINFIQSMLCIRKNLLIIIRFLELS